jgi:hypothetical protein
MSSRSLKFAALFALALGVSLFALSLPFAATVQAQQPTGSIPTVTGTPMGPYITVNLDLDFINVRSGPSEYFYPKIGILMRGQIAPALGRSPGGNWIQVYYLGVPGNVGWIYAPNVSLTSSGFLPLVEAPPTPTPPATSTINPTLESAYIQPQTPTRLPTFTPPAPVENPVFADISSNPSRVPLGLIVLSLAFVGMLIAVISFLRGR